MTQLQKNIIMRLHSDGTGYTEIAKMLNLSVNTVKSFGRRCKAETDGLHCKLCGKPYTQTPGKRAKRFCSDKCRLTWWHKNPAMLKTAQLKLCPGCGVEFMGEPGQKHCSHPCYIRARFGKVTASRSDSIVSTSPLVQTDATLGAIFSTKTG